MKREKLGHPSAWKSDIQENHLKFPRVCNTMIPNNDYNMEAIFQTFPFNSQRVYLFTFPDYSQC